MNRTLLAWLGLSLGVGCLLCARAAAAQDEDIVYEWETPDEGWMELSLLDAVVVQSDEKYTDFGANGTRSGLDLTQFEVGYAITDRWVTSLYGTFVKAPGEPLRYSGARVETRYRLFDRYQRIVDAALYGELKFQRGDPKQAQELETRLILERDVEDLRFAANPRFDITLKGSETSEGIEFGLASSVFYRRFRIVQPGVEYFADFGPLQSPHRASRQRHVLYPAVHLRPARNLDILLAFGVGLTSASDETLARTIISYEFETLRPSDRSR
jgi:hypothetical protein